jgi:hypothetical protein
VGKLYGEITLDLGTWLKQQPLFFVATSPLADDGFVNCSPKGMDSFRVLGPTQVAYLDLTGSGVETISHLRENGRIVFMFCAFTGLPKIVRLHGTGEVFTPGSPDWSQLREHFPEHLGERAIVSASLTRISDSCGFAVPQLEFARYPHQVSRGQGYCWPAKVPQREECTQPRRLAWAGAATIIEQTTGAFTNQACVAPALPKSQHSTSLELGQDHFTPSTNPGTPPTTTVTMRSG